MKKIILTIILVLLTNKTFSQLPLYRSFNEIPGEYYKDMDNDLDKFVGTWQFTDGGLTVFKIILKKRTHVFDDYYNSYFDMLVGEYQYIEEGMEQINTLHLIDSRSNVDENAIEGYMIRRCDACLPGQRNRVDIYLTDQKVTGKGRSMEGTLRYYLDNGIPKLKVGLKVNSVYLWPNEEVVYPPGYLPIPNGTYILTKI